MGAQRIGRKEVRTAGYLAVVVGPAGLPQQGGAARTKPRSGMPFDRKAGKMGRARGRENSDGESKLRHISYKQSSTVFFIANVPFIFWGNK